MIVRMMRKMVLGLCFFGFGNRVFVYGTQDFGILLFQADSDRILEAERGEVVSRLTVARKFLQGIDAPANVYPFNKEELKINLKKIRNLMDELQKIEKHFQDDLETIEHGQQMQEIFDHS